jgi:hypothetical protein
MSSLPWSVRRADRWTERNLNPSPLSAYSANLGRTLSTDRNNRALWGPATTPRHYPVRLSAAVFVGLSSRASLPPLFFRFKCGSSARNRHRMSPDLLGSYPSSSATSMLKLSWIFRKSDAMTPSKPRLGDKPSSPGKSLKSRSTRAATGSQTCTIDSASQNFCRTWSAALCTRKVTELRTGLD